MIEALAWTSPPIRTVELPEPEVEPLLPPRPQRSDEPIEPEPVPARVP